MEEEFGFEEYVEDWEQDQQAAEETAEVEGWEE